MASYRTGDPLPLCPPQVGTYGPHPGYGICAVADCWLATLFAEADDMEAAVKPATTTSTAKARTASFIMSNPSKKIWIQRRISSTWAVYPTH